MCVFLNKLLFEKYVLGKYLFRFKSHPLNSHRYVEFTDTKCTYVEFGILFKFFSFLLQQNIKFININSYILNSEINEYYFFLFLEFKKSNNDDQRMGRTGKKYLRKLNNNIVFGNILLYVFRNGMTIN